MVVAYVVRVCFLMTFACYYFFFCETTDKADQAEVSDDGEDATNAEEQVSPEFDSRLVQFVRLFVVVCW